MLGWFEAREWDVELGRVFEPEEIARGAQVAFSARRWRAILFGGIDPVGQELRIRNVPFRIVGVMASKGQTTWGQDQDDVVFVPLTPRASACWAATRPMRARSARSM